METTTKPRTVQAEPLPVEMLISDDARRERITVEALVDADQRRGRKTEKHNPTT